MPRAPALPHASPPRLRPSVSSVHPLSSFSPSPFHPHLSAQKVSKCQMGVVIIFNGIIFLHRNTVDLPAYVCVRTCVRPRMWKGKQPKGRKWSRRVENWKSLLSTKNKRTRSHTHTHTERGKTLRLR